jgi:hypothetical protein
VPLLRGERRDERGDELGGRAEIGIADPEIEQNGARETAAFFETVDLDEEVRGKLLEPLRAHAATCLPAGRGSAHQ